jgi:hypothetical protein
MTNKPKQPNLPSLPKPKSNQSLKANTRMIASPISLVKIAKNLAMDS